MIVPFLGVLGVLGALAALHAPQEGNRLWWVELEAQGPVRGLVLSADAEGITRLETELARGEERTLRVPVPCVSPLGAAGLDAALLPRIEFAGEGEVRAEAWAGSQPAAELQRAFRSLLARPRAVPGRARPHPGGAELVLLAAVATLVVAARRRLVARVAAAVGGGLVLGVLGARAGGAPEEVALLDVDAGDARALLHTAARHRLDLPRGAEWLEVDPPGRPLTLRVEPALPGQRGALLVEAAGSRITAIDRRDPPELSPEVNAWRPLAAVWVRSPEGGWVEHGSWPLGEALPPPVEASGKGEHTASRPGWLSAGLPPGRGVLLARVERDGGAPRPFWLRITGWEP